MAGGERCWQMMVPAEPGHCPQAGAWGQCPAGGGTIFRGYRPQVANGDLGFPTGSEDDRELLLQWLGYLRGAVLRNLDGIDDPGARWTPEGKLIPLVGIVHHLTLVEWRWIDGGFGGAEVNRTEGEFRPGPEVTLAAVLSAYRERAAATDAAVRSLPLDQASGPKSWAVGKDLRWVLLHLINETARHAGHADATRELLDGKTGE
jgi:hypothetical protein